MALTLKQNGEIAGGSPTLHRHYDVSAANTQLTLTPTVGYVRKILAVTASYSANVTKNVTVTLNSGAGAAYDNLLTTIALAAAADGSWIPAGEVILADDDVLDVVSEAGGVGVTCALSVYSLVY